MNLKLFVLASTCLILLVSNTSRSQSHPTVYPDKDLLWTATHSGDTNQSWNTSNMYHTNELLHIPSSDFTSSLQGISPGVEVLDNGHPGYANRVIIRNQWVGSELSNPLYIVDGIPLSYRPVIAFEDIESIEIIKDGAAGAVYGSRANNGAIVIQTKKGTPHKLRVQFHAMQGIQQTTSAGLPLLNNDEYFAVDQRIWQSQGSYSPLLYLYPSSLEENMDYSKAIQRKNPVLGNYNLNLNGGKKFFSIKTNFNVFKEEGILEPSNYGHLTARVNMGLDFDKFHMAIAYSGVGIGREEAPDDLYITALATPPFGELPNMDELGEELVDPSYSPTRASLIHKLNESRDYEEQVHSLMGGLAYKILPSLSLTGKLYASQTNYQRKIYQPRLLFYLPDSTEPEMHSSTVDHLREEDYIKYESLIDGDILFKKQYKGHAFAINSNLTINLIAIDYENNGTSIYTQGDISGMIVSEPSYRSGRRNPLSTDRIFHTGINYSFRQRYHLRALYANDKNIGGRRAIENKAFSAGWQLSNEAFLKDIAFISELQTIYSYSIIEGYAQRDDPYSTMYYPIQSSLIPYFSSTNIAYYNSEPEQKAIHQIKTCMDLMNNRIGFSMELYKATNNHAQIPVITPHSAGTTMLPSNYYFSYSRYTTTFIYRGIELSAYLQEQLGNNGSIYLRTSFDRHTQRRDKDDDYRVPTDMSSGSSGLYYSEEEASSAYAFYLLPTDGVIKDTAELNAYQNNNPNAGLGEIRYVDSDDDGAISNADREYYGSPYPTFTTSLQLKVDYWNFDLSILAYYSHGAKVYNATKQRAYSSNRHADLYYMWTPANADSDIPAGSQFDSHNSYDIFLEDASYLRIRYIALGYTFKLRPAKSNHQSLRVYLSATNPFTFTQYSGFDPEVAGSSFTTRGVDNGSYPIAKSIILGVQVNL